MYVYKQADTNCDTKLYVSCDFFMKARDDKDASYVNNIDIDI